MRKYRLKHVFWKYKNKLYYCNIPSLSIFCFHGPDFLEKVLETKCSFNLHIYFWFMSYNPVLFEITKVNYSDAMHFPCWAQTKRKVFIVSWPWDPVWRQQAALVEQMFDMSHNRQSYYLRISAQEVEMSKVEKSAEHDMSGGKTTVACTRAILVAGMQCIPPFTTASQWTICKQRTSRHGCHACLHRQALIRSSCYIAFRMHNVSSFHASVLLTYEALCLDLVYQKRILPQLLSINPNNSFIMVIENNQMSAKKMLEKK